MKIFFALLTTIVSSAICGAQVVPVVDLNVRGLLGGVIDGRFVDAPTAFKQMKATQDYSVYSALKGKLPTNVTLTINGPSENEPCDDFYSVGTETEIDSGVAVGANAGWSVQAQTTNIGLTDRTYLKIVSDVLRTKGLPTSKARIEQAFRVDLEGDGVDEVLITASSYRTMITPSAKKGDYSFVLLRKIVGGKVQNILLDGEFHKKYVEFGAPSRFEISAVADLNGDGQMEIVIFSEYYEGGSAWVLQIKNGKAVQVKELSSSCGV